MSFCQYHISIVSAQHCLGKGCATKSDEFSETFQTAFDPHPPSFSENDVENLLWQIWVPLCREVIQLLTKHTLNPEIEHGVLTVRGIEHGVPLPVHGDWDGVLLGNIVEHVQSMACPFSMGSHYLSMAMAQRLSMEAVQHSTSAVSQIWGDKDFLIHTLFLPIKYRETFSLL